jgi:uncharacterized protein
MVKKNILILTGDETVYHNPAETGDALKHILKENGYNAELSENMDMLLMENLKPFNAVILYMNKQKITQEQEQGLFEGISGFTDGKPRGFIGLHTATCSFQESEKYSKMLGGRFIAHPPMKDVLQIKIKNPTHPVIKGIKDFEIIDEFYLMEVFPPFQTLLTCEYEGFEMPLAWVKPFGMGRVFYNALGHAKEQINNENYRKILINALEWSTKSA